VFKIRESAFTAQSPRFQPDPKNKRATADILQAQYLYVKKHQFEITTLFDKEKQHV
jgi:hypothetical protein